MPSNDPAMLSASELLRHYRRRDAVAGRGRPRPAWTRIERWNDRVHAFCLVDAEGALAAAHASEARWLRGRAAWASSTACPATIKDLVLTRGWPTRRGSQHDRGQPPAASDAPATARLREAGAVLLGSTTTPEFGWKGVTDNPARPASPAIPGTRRARRAAPAAGAGGGRGARHGRAACRHRRRRLDPHPGGLRRHRRPEADLRPRAGLAAVAVRHRRPSSGR